MLYWFWCSICTKPRFNGLVHNIYTKRTERGRQLNFRLTSCYILLELFPLLLPSLLLSLPCFWSLDRLLLLLLPASSLPQDPEYSAINRDNSFQTYFELKPKSPYHLYFTLKLCYRPICTSSNIDICILNTSILQIFIDSY